MFCTSCGTKNSEDGNFCKQCGVKLEKQASTRISEEQFERAMPEDEQVTSLLERAYRARKSGDRLGAIALCLEALALRPKSTSCHSLLGQLYEQGGEHDLAIEQYERVLELNPGSIADRVKLDELRGEVPSVVTQKRSPTHIVLADRAKEGAPADYRAPALALAAVALMVMGGIVTMQFMARQGESSRSSGGTVRVASAGGSPSQGAGQSAQRGSPLTGQNSPSGDPGSAYTGSIGLGSGQPAIIIQNPPQQPTVRYIQSPPYPQGPASIVDSRGSRNLAPNGIDNGTDEKDMGSDKVHLDTMEAGSGGSDEARAQIKSTDVIKVHQAPSGASGGSAAPDSASAGSDSRKNQERAVLLTQQGQYKLAGSAYIQALDGAGEDTAYIYRRAGWCFEKAGDKATAINYYQHGIDEAEKLLSAKHQVEIARNLIRQCKTGISACTN